MVNEAIRQMVSGLHGEECWERIRKEAGCEVEHFHRMDAYPDELTYRLVAAAAAELGVPASELLHAFGEYWVKYARTGGYADFFRACDSYAGFLVQLDAMHGRLELAFPDLKAPQFSCIVESPERIEVIYRSHREGLSPFVAGLLTGLGEPFGVTARVENAGGEMLRADGVEAHFTVTLSRE
jgi:hypothetical protein